MASKLKYNPDDVERWVTVKGARIPIMKDGSFGVGTKDDDIDDEERAMDLVDSKDYIGDKALKQKVIENLKGSGYDLGKGVTVQSAEVVRWDGKSDEGIVEATYTLRGGSYGKGQEFTEELRVPVRKSQITSRNAKYDTSRIVKNNPLQPKIQKRAGMVFAVSGEGNVLQSWKESEFTERKYQNFLKKLDAANPTRKK